MIFIFCDAKNKNTALQQEAVGVFKKSKATMTLRVLPSADTPPKNAGLKSLGNI
ncbi:MAG: hypothetical protein IKM94_04000 [Alphaproteobacteria bacterium]|nr:hypothetical protein [Alphaproteobacteria bacterium]